MSKKNKKKDRDIWNFTAEDQKKASKKLWESEQIGESIFNPSKHKKDDYFNNVGGSLSILPKGIRKEIDYENGRKKTSGNIRIQDEYSSNKLKSNIISSGVDTNLVYSDFNYILKNDVSEFGIHVRDLKELERFVIDDGISPITISYRHIRQFYQSTVIKGISDDDVNNIISKIFLYIITRKHPVCVMTYEEFNNYFNHIKSYDLLKFPIFDVDNYILLYYFDALDEGEDNPVLTTIINIGDNIAGNDSSIFLQFIAYVAFTAGYVSSSFFIEDDDYVKAYKDFSKDNIPKYMELIKSDKKTIIVNEDTDPLKDIDMYDAEEICCEAREILDKISPENDEEYEDMDVNDYRSSTLEDVGILDNSKKSDELGDQIIQVMQQDQLSVSSNINDDRNKNVQDQSLVVQSYTENEIIKPTKLIDDSQSQQKSMTISVIRKN